MTALAFDPPATRCADGDRIAGQAAAAVSGKAS